MINKRLIAAVPESRRYIAGNVLCQWVSLLANIALLGAMAQHTGIAYDIFDTAVRQTVPQKFVDMNLAALRLGYDAAKAC